MKKERKTQFYHTWKVFQICKNLDWVVELDRRQFGLKISRFFKRKSFDLNNQLCDFILEHRKNSEVTRKQIIEIIETYLDGRSLLNFNVKTSLFKFN